MSENTKVELLNDDYAFSDKHGGVIYAVSAQPLKVEAKTPMLKKENGANADLAIWGKDNLFPQNVIELVDGDPELPPLLEWKGRALQGKELIAIQSEYDEKQRKYVTTEVNDPELKAVLSGTMVERYWREACVDFTWFNQFWPDFIKSVDGNTLAQIATHEAAWCRWETQNDKGISENCYLSARWDENPSITDSTKVMKIAAVDPYNPLLIEEIKANTKLDRFVYAINYPSPNKPYYPSAAWTSFLFSDWFKIKGHIPKWKLKYMTQVLSASYIVTIPINYWTARYPDWAKMTDNQRQDAKKTKVKEINDTLTGVEGVGKTILSEVGIDDNGKPIPMITIEKIKSGLEDGKYGEDSAEVSQFLNRSLNVDPTLVGSGPGRGRDAGSGSDKRVAFNIYCALLTPFRKIILEPLYFFLRYNGYFDKYPTLNIHVVEVELQTLDEGSTSKDSSPFDYSNKEIDEK